MHPAPPNRHPDRATDRPLASFVLRLRGRPASIWYELLDLRSGESRRFRRPAAVLAYLQRAGLVVDSADPAADELNDTTP